MNEPTAQHQTPRLTIPAAALRIATVAAYAIAGALAGQLVGILLFY